MDSMVDNDTWELADCPKNVKVIDSWLVLWKKLNADGLTKWIRSRLVEKGHVQKAGIDYDETFRPLTCYDTVRAVFAFAAVERLQLR
jgi:hypothetical protein